MRGQRSKKRDKRGREGVLGRERSFTERRDAQKQREVPQKYLGPMVVKEKEEGAAKKD
jgi:hypothetical protein